MKASLFHFFSKFSTELLLLEGLAILFLTAIYCACYVLRKRRLGNIDRDVPGPIVKAYLNQLIGEAEAMRAQLFGLLAGNGVAGATLATAGGPVDTAAILAALQATQAAGGTASDPQLVQQIKSLETKMGEQGKNLQTVVIEKERIEKELAALRAGAGAGASAAADGSALSPTDLSALHEKIASLESRLAEYSIIEDDLANLKRLQQENAQLRAALAGQGGAPIAAAAPAPVQAPEPVAAAAPEVDPNEAAFEAALAGTEIASSPDPAPDPDPAPAPDPSPLAAAEATVAAPDPVPAPIAAFEGLVDQVEQSLQSPPTTLDEPEASATDKSDSDLVEEFEKMLNA